MLRTDVTAASVGEPTAGVGRTVSDTLHRAWRRRSIPAILVGLLGVVGFFLPSELLYASSTALVAGLVGLALYLPIAALRELPLNAAGMTGLSAYVFALAATHGGIGNWLLGMLLAAGTAVGVSLLGGLAALAVTGLYFLVVSLVVQVGIEKVAFAVPGLTGGTSGFGVWQPVLGGWFDTARCIYLIVGVVVLCVALVVRSLLRSRPGFHWVLVGHVPEGASAVGLRNWLVKLTVFALSGLLIGLAGVLSAFINGTPPTTVSFTLIYSVIFVAIPIASGLRDLSSVWLVAAAFTAIPIILEGYHLAPNLISGCILLIALGLGYNRDRIGPEARRLWRRMRGVREADGVEGPAGATAVGAEVTLTGVHVLDSTALRDGAAPTTNGRTLALAAVSGSSALEGRDITVDFGGVRAVDRVSVRVGPGQRVGIVGANGAGKTTLFNALTGFVPLHEGRVLLGSDDITRWPSLKRARAGIRRTFQQPRLAEVLTVEQNIACGHGHNSSERRERVEWLLDHFGVAPLRGVPVAALPFGVRREVELIRALAETPQVLMLDEPVSGLEDEEAEKLVETLLELQAREGWGLLAIEHDLKFITAVAEHLMVMEDGHLLVEGPLHDVMKQDQVRRVYLGELVTA
jgi:branched-chain amino acid transport system permease protein